MKNRAVRGEGRPAMKGLVPMLADGTLTYSDVQNPLTVPGSRRA